MPAPSKVRQSVSQPRVRYMGMIGHMAGLMDRTSAYPKRKFVTCRRHTSEGCHQTWKRFSLFPQACVASLYTSLFHVWRGRPRRRGSAGSFNSKLADWNNTASLNISMWQAGKLTQQQQLSVLQNSRQFCAACSSQNLSVRNVTDEGIWYMQDLLQTACL